MCLVFLQLDALKKENRELHAGAAAAATAATEAAAKVADLGSRLEAAEKEAAKLQQQVKKLERENSALPTSEALVRLSLLLKLTVSSLLQLY